MRHFIYLFLISLFMLNGASAEANPFYSVRGTDGMLLATDLDTASTW